jgi:probable phosphoglycerate mutase
LNNITLEEKTLGPRIFLIRHGQPEQHSGKIFLGQADVPLSERGKREAVGAADRLIEYRARIKRIYTSDLTRAKETAEIIAGQFGGVPVVPDKLFREMAMGSWDGELIEDIKAKFPEEYAKRGEDLRNYRIPGGENFYDLRGRVTREFYRVFKEGFCGDVFGEPQDLVIVAHLGVITVLSEELQVANFNGGLGRNFPTGSVTAYEAPDWLFVPGRKSDI